jgi:iron(III) transport system substrate-binding protein
MVFPDQGKDQIGTLFIPNTLAITKGAPHAEHARKLVDFLLSPTVEERLAKGESAQFPVNPAVKTPSRAAPRDPAKLKWMEADFGAAADKWESASGYIENEFLR